jgi:hypothetical protein
MFSIKVHSLEDGKLIADCDDEILGQSFSDGELEIHISESFYGSKGHDSETLCKHFNEAAQLNLMGEKTIAAAIDSGIIKQENVLSICGLDHAQVYLI